MLYTRTAIEHREGTVTASLAIAVGIDGLAAERAIDDVIADSFPASDPPSWNSGVARPAPVGPFAPQVSATATTPISDAGDADAGAGDVVDVSDHRTGASRTSEP